MILEIVVLVIFGCDTGCGICAGNVDGGGGCDGHDYDIPKSSLCHSL